MAIKFVDLPKNEAVIKKVADDLPKKCATSDDCLKIEQDVTMSQIVANTAAMWMNWKNGSANVSDNR